MNVGKRIKEIRKHKGISADTIAEKLGVSRSTIFRYENGDIEKVPTDVLEMIANALGTTPGKLMGWEEDKLSTIFNKLNQSRQNKVVKFAKQQLDEQRSNVVEFSNKHIEIEIKGYVSAGRGEYLSDDARETVTISGPVPSDYDFAVKVNGDSMQPLLSDKQVIFIKKLVDCDDVRNNQIVIAKIGSDAYVKKISIDSKGIKLISLNKEYADISVTDAEDFKVFGTVII